MVLGRAGGEEFRVLEFTGDANVGGKGRFMTPAEEYRYEFGTIKFPSIGRMEVYTNANDRTRIMWASLGRIVASSRVSDDDGLSLSRCDQYGWTEDQIPKVSNFETRADMKSPVALVIRLPNHAKGKVYSDMGTIRYQTNEGRFAVAYGTERRENGIFYRTFRQKPTLTCSDSNNRGYSNHVYTNTCIPSAV